MFLRWWFATLVTESSKGFCDGGFWVILDWVDEAVEGGFWGMGVEQVEVCEEELEGVEAEELVLEDEK